MCALTNMTHASGLEFLNDLLDVIWVDDLVVLTKCECFLQCQMQLRPIVCALTNMTHASGLEFLNDLLDAVLVNKVASLPKNIKGHSDEGEVKSRDGSGAWLSVSPPRCGMAT